MESQPTTNLTTGTPADSPAAPPQQDEHMPQEASDTSLVFEMPDLEGLEFLLDEIEDQIAPLA